MEDTKQQGFKVRSELKAGFSWNPMDWMSNLFGKKQCNCADTTGDNITGDGLNHAMADIV